MRALLGWGKVLVVILVAIIVGETFKPLKDLEQLMKNYQVPLLTVTIGITAVGFLMFMGGIVAIIMAKGEPMSHEEVEDLQRRERNLRAWPYLRRKSTYRIMGKTIGKQAHVEASFRDINARVGPS